MRLKLNLRQARNLIMIVTGLVIVGWLGYWWGSRQIKLTAGIKPRLEVVNRVQPEEFKEVDFSLFWTVWQRLKERYLDPEKLDEEKMVYRAISGMVSALGDPYTVFLDPQQNKQAKEDLNGSFFGVGIQLGYRDGQLAVVAPLAGMPAERMGVKAGDLILKIKDEKKGVDKETTGMSLPEAVATIRGEWGTAVTLTLLHEGAEEVTEVTIVREEVIVPAVELEWLEATASGKKVAQVKLSRFSERLDQEWEAIVGKILAEPSDFSGLVLDMRNNPGGYLLSAVDIASEFIESGVVVKQQGREEGRDYKVDGQGRLIGVKLIVLVNKGTASSAEIVAGALRDRLGIKLVGEKTFGKGTIQDAEELPGGVGLHVTTARWLLPGGDWIQEEGLKPDLVVEMVDDEGGIDEQLQKAIEVL